jgi:hypothetical protein
MGNQADTDLHVGELNIGPQLTNAQQTELINLLQKFPDVFQLPKSSPGQTNVIKHSIRTFGQPI